ncbi:MAG: HDOD domain-containing protein [Candidatus Hydrogenedentes bacterium]|nr:HDOD domain-containing protein [Candidatus Hydrogenedentota bacterium]
MQNQRQTTKAVDKTPPRIGDLLLRAELISPTQLQEALEKQRADGGKLVENLIALEHLDSQVFVRFLSKQPGVASIDLLNYMIPAEVIKLVDRDFALKHEILPIDKMGRHLTVGMACPLDSKTVADLEEKTGMRVRPLLVSMNDIRVALGNYYRSEDDVMEQFSLDGDLKLASPAKVTTPGSASIALVESSIKFEKVVHLIREVSSLPALPETIANVQQAMENPDTSTQDIAKIIEQDPLLAAKVVSLANSAAYSFAHSVDTIERATALLGLREVYSVVLASAVIEYFKEGDHFNHKKFWKRSMICATACKIIAQACRPKGAGSVFAAGLSHDIGRAVFAEIAPKQYAGVDQDLPEMEVIARENELFGLAHPEVGFLLADGWGLPDDIKEPIRFHHDFQQAQQSQEMVAITALGAAIADAMTRGNGVTAEIVAETQAALLQTLDITGQQLAEIYERTDEAINAQQGAQ